MNAPAPAPGCVLITSAARKVWLVEAFRRALAAEGGGEVLAADCDPLAPALYRADRGLRLPRADAPGYEATLLDLCRRERVELLVPTRDAELPWFAERRARFAEIGTRVLVSAPAAIERCRDKRAFADFCAAHGFATPPAVTLPAAADDFPLFAKPRIGQGSGGARRIESAAGLAGLDAEHWIVQRFDGGPEYTLDVCAGFDGTVLSVVPRRRLQVLAGESITGVTVMDPALVELGAAVVRALGLIGHATVQCFHDAAGSRLIEVNPRFGGGAALGFAAGADSPRWLLRLARGGSVEPQLGCQRDGLYLLRHSHDVFVAAEDVCR